LELGLGNLATGFGGGDGGGAGGVHECSLQNTRPVLLARRQVTLPPRLEIILAFASKLLLPVAWYLAALCFDGLLAVGSCARALPRAQPTVPLVGHAHAPLPLPTVRLALLLTLLLALPHFGSCHRQHQEGHGGHSCPLLVSLHF